MQALMDHFGHYIEGYQGKIGPFSRFRMQLGRNHFRVSQTLQSGSIMIIFEC
jgi:hypothetical protein